MLAEGRRAVVVALPAWLASRVLVGIALLVTRGLHGGYPRAGAAPGAHGWWAWDAGWYRAIAVHGYPHTGGEELRFFPLLPLLGRGLGTVLAGHDGIALVVVANLCALLFAAGVVLFTERELDRATAPVAAWLTLLAPGAAVLALAYSEPLAGMLAVGFVLAVRSTDRAVWWAVPVGLLAGLARPTGILLAVIAFVELLRRRPRVALAGATIAPLAGAAAYCAWTWHVYGNARLPFSTQSKPGLRGGLANNPVHALLFSSTRGGLDRPVRIAVALLAITLLVVVWRLLPLSVAAWSTLALASALTSARADSLLRYLSSDFPLLVALAHVARARLAWLTGFAFAAAMTAVAVSGFGAGMVF
jgi:hypothetical protein